MTVAASSTEAEYIASASAAKEAVWLRQLLREIGLFVNPRLYPEKPLPLTPMYVDNQGTIVLTKNPEYHQRTKHIDVQYHLVRERVERGDITVTYTFTAEMTADILTKSLSRIKHEHQEN